MNFANLGRDIIKLMCRLYGLQIFGRIARLNRAHREFAAGLAAEVRDAARIRTETYELYDSRCTVKYELPNGRADLMILEFVREDLMDAYQRFIEIEVPEYPREKPGPWVAWAIEHIDNGLHHGIVERMEAHHGGYGQPQWRYSREGYIHGVAQGPAIIRKYKYYGYIYEKTGSYVDGKREGQWNISVKTVYYRNGERVHCADPNV